MTSARSIWAPFRTLSRGGSRIAVLLLGLLSGGLFWAAIPTPDLTPLAWVCLVPILAMALRSDSTPMLSGALVAGLVSSAGRIYWIAPTLELYGHVPILWAGVTTALLGIYMAVYWGAFAVICRVLPPRSSA